MYGAAGTGGVLMRKRDIINPWIAPTTICFPTPVTPIHPHFRPLHVWGHPTHVDQSLMHLRPKNLLPHSLSPTPPPNTWPLTLPPRSDPNYGNPNHQRVSTSLIIYLICFIFANYYYFLLLYNIMGIIFNVDAVFIHFEIIFSSRSLYDNINGVLLLYLFVFMIFLIKF